VGQTPNVLNHYTSITTAQYNNSSILQDSDSCLSAWLSFLKVNAERIEAAEFETYLDSAANTTTKHHKPTMSPCSKTSTVFTLTTTSTLTRPVSSECDKYPRATSISESVVIFTTTVWPDYMCWRFVYPMVYTITIYEHYVLSHAYFLGTWRRTLGLTPCINAIQARKRYYPIKVRGSIVIGRITTNPYHEKY
jgi:hypothetical protein